MSRQDIRVTINGTGFAADYTANVYSMIPHRNEANITLAGVTSGKLANAEKFAARHGVARAFADHEEMVNTIHPQIDNVACANNAHGQYVMESVRAGVDVIVLEKPPVIWPGYAEQRRATAEQRKQETMEYLAEVLDTVRGSGSKLFYAEEFVYVDGVKGMVQLMVEAHRTGKGKVLYQRGVCAHQGSHAPAYDTPEKSGGGALFNKACHPLGPCLLLKQVEGLLNESRPIRPLRVSATALQILKHQSQAAGEHFRVMQNVDDFARVTVVFDDQTVAEVHGHDLSISGIRNELSVITDFAQYDVRINPNNETELFLPDGKAAGDILLREKLPTPKGTSFPRPNQFYSHGYVNEMSDAIECVLRDDYFPQSGPMMAWDTMAVLMAGYESSERGGQYVDVGEYCQQREFTQQEMPDASRWGQVFQRK